LAAQVCQAAGSYVSIAVLLVLLEIGFSTRTSAQLITGSVTGTVIDPSAAAVVGATARLTNTGTSVTQTAQSDASGNFQFLLLAPGTYSLEVAAPGFKTFRRDGIAVDADRSLAVPVSLSVGQATETVEVAAGAVLLDANTSELGSVMDNKQVDDLPLESRNPLGLANLIPTVRGQSLFGGTIGQTWHAGVVNIGGGESVSNAFLIDGMANDKIGDAAGPMSYLTVDSTEEFKVLTNSMSAEFGRTGGGVISVISKSGTNAFHGSLFEFLRNTVFDANEFFSNRSGGSRPPVKVNQFGGAVGGPIKKDKLFFFYNYEDYRERRGNTQIFSSPSVLQREGNFSQTYTSSGQLITIYDPLTTVADPANPGQYIRQPFPGNVIPANRISQMSQAVFGMYPMGNIPGQPITGTNNLFLSAGTLTNAYNTGVKIDYIFTPERRLAVRYSKADTTPTTPNYFNNFLGRGDLAFVSPRQSATMQFTDAFSPTLLLDAKLGYNYDGEHGCGNFSLSQAASFSDTALGIPAATVNQFQKMSGKDGNCAPNGSFPVLTIGDLGDTATSNQIGSESGEGKQGSTWASGISLTKVRGAHTIKGGFEHRFYTFNPLALGSPAFTFDRGFTQGPNPTVPSATGGYGLASFILGDPSAGSASILQTGTLGQRYEALFVQDDWKATRKLTLNLGLRWEYEAPITDRWNEIANFNPSIASPLQVPGMNLVGAVTFPGVNGNPRGIANPSYRHFEPRTGFAYQAKNWLVVRGGYGISFLPTKGTNIPQFSGFSGITNMVASVNGGLTPYNTVSNPFPNGLTQPTGSSLGGLTAVGSTVQALLRNVTPGYAQQWNFTTQFQPWQNWLIETAYIGNKGTHLLTIQAQNLDQLNPQYLSLGSALLQSVPNPFYGIVTSGPLSTPTVARQQLLLPYPQYTGVQNYWSFLGDSSYHAFTLKVEKRLSRGVSILGAYTFSKLLDGATGNTGAIRIGTDPNTPVINWYNLKTDYSKSIDDIPQRLVATVMWQVPFFSKATGWQKAVLGGWQVNSILTLQSGQTIALTDSVGTPNPNRPNVVAGINPNFSGQSLNEWFNTAAYSIPAPFTFGNASRTIPNASTDGLFNLDFSLFKSFTIKEKFNLQLRGEAFNLTNTPTFYFPGQDVSNQNFGVVSSTVPATGSETAHGREMQMSLRLIF
jgi:hypothetical protein